MAHRLRTSSAALAVRMTILALVVAVGISTPFPPAFADDDLTINGRGYGHGRGMGQWGSYGYAVDYGWDYRQILDHFYRGTRTASDAGNPLIDVAVTALDGRETLVVGPGLTVNGVPVGQPAVRVRRLGVNAFEVYSGPGCSGPWSPWGGWAPSGVRVETAGDAVKLDDLPRLCESNQLRGYRGAIVVVDRGNDQGTVNRVRLDDYLRGVVPRESPASWGSAAGGSGLNALKAQAVAARSYALASRFSSYAQTCDSIRCQVYGGAFVQPFGGAIQPLEDARTDRAVLETTGEVRRNSSGAVARTEFSASTGGWSAGGEFPAVEDLGDATAANPHRSWSATFTLSEMASRLGTAPILDVQVAARNGLGSDGGRVLSVRVSTASGAVTFSGLEFRQRLGLKSDWFVVAGAPTPAASSYVTALYVDILQRQPDVASLAGWVDALAGGMQRADLARGFVYSTEHLNRRVDDVYLSALRRHAESSGLQGWVAALQRGTPWVSVVSSIYGSAESLASLGGGDVQSWVDATYQAILGRPAEPGAASWWAGFASERGRFFVARAIYTSAEARERRLDSYYRSYLQRPVDPAGLSGFGPMLVGNGDLDVPVGLVSSGEYWLRALDRFPP